MLFNLKEAGTAEADKQQTKDLLNLLNIDEEIVIEDLVRMGKPREGKPKPIQSVSVKRKILAKTPKLRDMNERMTFLPNPQFCDFCFFIQTFGEKYRLYCGIV